MGLTCGRWWACHPHANPHSKLWNRIITIYNTPHVKHKVTTCTQCHQQGRSHPQFLTARGELGNEGITSSCVLVRRGKSREENSQDIPEVVLFPGEWVVPEDEQFGHQLLAQDATTHQQLGNALCGHLPEQGTLVEGKSKHRQ